ncbi:MAG: LysR family transcriptional regulator [Eubacterium sp.]
MIEIHLLEQLDAFARLGTLSAASEELHISQPALTRSMQKLEQELDVSLFNREKNRIHLNDNGKLAAEYAARLLSENRDMIRIIQAYDRSHRTISLGSCAPLPVYPVTMLLQQFFPDMTISTDICNDEKIASGFTSGKFQLVILHERPEDTALYYKPCSKESLCVSVPPAHPLASLSSVSFSDLADLPMLLFTKIGFWYDLCIEKIPHHHFIEESFIEIASASALPTFYSRAFSQQEGVDNLGRTIVPISDPEASVTYYLTCKKEDRKRFSSIFSHLPASGK